MDQVKKGILTQDEVEYKFCSDFGQNDIIFRLESKIWVVDYPLEPD